MGLSTTQDAEQQRAFEELKNSIGPRSTIILPEDSNYNDSKRIWNAMFDNKNPSIILQATGVADVQVAIHYAQRVGVVVTPRGGGHSWAGFSTVEGGVVIDFCKMRSVHVDPILQTVTVEPGVLLGELDHETQAFGLAVPVGVISHTGVFGLVLGGGVGWLCRKYGGSVDNIISANIVLADGRFVKASKTENADLFWAIRGAAQNFGIVTSLTIQAHPVGLAYRGSYVSTELHRSPSHLIQFYPMDQIEEVLHAINEFQKTAPREYNCEVYNRGRIDGSSEMFLKICYSFYLPQEEAEKAAEPLKEIGRPIEHSWKWITHVENQKIFDMESPHHRRYYAKSGSINFDDMNSHFVDAFKWGVANLTSPYCMVEMIGLGGAMKDSSAEHAAFFPLRSQDWLVNVVASWNNDVPAEEDQKHIEWCRESFQRLHTKNPGYINMFADACRDTMQERLSRAFGNNLNQLRLVKRRYDPYNFFRHNVNVLPATDEDLETESTFSNE
ncbi:FAD/FMN-containing dehydrogenase [Planoprotostelium fungivorum]|uniref:FAD/FMN-containing dehydrogenase n=1 Tax=Planoprotostelium fungivorum TaxID=1890364 RepID=A0A2P6NKS3_9EUKA|nr:FAD/FMN-containing dehydrogenase [Planoprotostelium fungivorum]